MATDATTGVGSGPTGPTGPTAPANDKLDAAVLKIAGVVVLAAIMSILDTTVVGVAQNAFQTTWHTTPAVTAWTMTGYTLALATVIPITGWAADRFGTKRLFIMSIVLFVCGSVLCATAWGIGPLIAFRVVQGLGGGMLMPLGMTIMTRAAGPERVGRVMAVLGVPMLLGPIAGPILGGWLIDVASWHWIFLINVPIGIVALIYAFIVLPKDSPQPSESFDTLGFVLLSPGLAIFLYGVSSIPGAGTVMSAKVLVSCAVGLALIAAFVHHALTRAEHPLIDLHLFRNRELSIAVITMACFAIAFFGAMLLFPQYFIGVRGETPLMAGVLGAPMGLGAMLTMPIAGSLTDKFGPGKFVLTGLVLIVIGMFPLTMLTTDTSFLVTSGAFFVMGLGMGMTMMPTMTAALRTLRDAQIARGSTLMNITQQISASIGTAVMSVLLTTFLKQETLAPLAVYANSGGTQARLALKAVSNKTGVPVQALLDKGLDAAATAFSHTILIALILVACTLIPAFFLPRSRARARDQLAAEEAFEVGGAVL